jgi:hypothetical protein
MSRASWLGNVAQWGSAIISLIAMLVTGIIAYFNLVRKVDELTVVVHRPPAFYRVNAKTLKAVAAKVAFVNSGNRTAAVLSVAVQIRQQDGEAPDHDCYGLVVESNMAPLTIRPGEIITQEFNIKPFESLIVKDEKSDIILDTASIGMEGATYDLCLVFEVMSPDKSNKVTAQRGRFKITPINGPLIQIAGKQEWSAPISLLKP